MPSIRNRFYPYHAYAEVDVVNFYSLLQTGLGGTLVKIVTGAANPATLATDGWAPGSVGGVIPNAFSYRYETKARIQPTASGDTRWDALGLTLLNTLEVDENGIPLKYDTQRAKEIGAVISGETVPVITRAPIMGLFGQYIDSSLGNVQPGNVLVPSRSGNGLLAAVDPENATVFSASGVISGPLLYGPQHVVGKLLTSLPTALNTGVTAEFAANGGYALFQLNCNA